MPVATLTRLDADLSGMAGRLVDLAGRLADLLTRETALVRAMRIKEIAPLQDEKIKLTGQYQTIFKALTSAGDGQALPQAIKEPLAASGQRLAAAVVENELALRVGKIATERLIGSIVDAVKTQKKFSLSYAARQAAPRHTFMTAAAVDRRL